MASNRDWPKLAAATACLVVVLFVVLQQLTSSPGQFSTPSTRRRDFSIQEPSLAARANDGNNAIPGWSSPLSTYLATPFDQLDAKGKAVVVGKQMVCMLDEELDSTHSPQSSYTDLQDVSKIAYGWTYSRVAISDHEDSFLSEFGLSYAFKDLSISEDKADWYQVSTVHSFKSTSNGITYPATYGTYQSLFNLRDGVIVATTNHGPAWQNQQYDMGIPNEKMVPLQRWSDLVFLALQKTTTDIGVGNIKNVNHIFRHNLLNSDVKEKLVMVTGGSTIYDYPGKWPGLSYPITENQALAAWSTANGKGAAYLLGTHKSQMGDEGD